MFPLLRRPFFFPFRGGRAVGHGGRRSGLLGRRDFRGRLGQWSRSWSFPCAPRGTIRGRLVRRETEVPFRVGVKKRPTAPVWCSSRPLGETGEERAVAARALRDVHGTAKGKVPSVVGSRQGGARGGSLPRHGPQPPRAPPAPRSPGGVVSSTRAPSGSREGGGGPVARCAPVPGPRSAGPPPPPPQPPPAPPPCWRYLRRAPLPQLPPSGRPSGGGLGKDHGPHVPTVRPPDRPTRAAERCIPRSHSRTAGSRASTGTLAVTFRVPDLLPQEAPLPGGVPVHRSPGGDGGGWRPARSGPDPTTPPRGFPPPRSRHGEPPGERPGVQVPEAQSPRHLLSPWRTSPNRRARPG